MFLSLINSEYISKIQSLLDGLPPAGKIMLLVAYKNLDPLIQAMKEMKKKTINLLGALLITASLVAFAGCAGMADAASAVAGLGRISEKTSTYDGKRIVTVSPAPLYDPQSWLGVPFFLGAQWNEAHPDFVGMILQYRSSSSSSVIYVSFHGLEVNVNGKEYKFDSGGNTNHSHGTYNTVTRTIYTESSSVIPIPLELLKEMLESERCTIRISSSEGYADALFSQERIPGGQGTAKYYIKSMLERI